MDALARSVRGRVQWLVVAGGVAVTVVAAVVPGWFEVRDAPGLRVALEVTSLCLLLFAATVLAVPPDRDVRATRDAFVAGLITLGLGNGVFGVLPVVTEGRLTIDRGLGFYPWMGARFVAGLLFLAAAAQRPRLGLARTVAAGLGLLLVVEGTLIASGDRLPVPVTITAGPMPAIEVVNPVAHVALQAVPGLLFAVGAVFAGRLYDESRAPAHLWLSLALILQVFTQFNEIVHPAILGPVVTAADAFRLLSFLALLTGGLFQLRFLYRSRSRVVLDQARDLQRQGMMVDRLASLARQEHDLRTLVAHEFATPLASIRAYAHVLGADVGALSARQRQAVEGIAGEARRLTELMSRMEELRDLERDAFTCDLRPVRAQGLVTDAVRFVHGLLGAHPVTASCVDVRVHADPVRFGQLVRNVVTNAARHAPPDVPIEIEGRVVAGRFELSVTDRGPGIPPEERSRVMERYARGRHATATGTAGQGIGLYVAARIAAAHGGTLEIHDPPDGTGTRVVVTLGLAT